MDRTVTTVAYTAPARAPSAPPIVPADEAAARRLRYAAVAASAYAALVHNWVLPAHVREWWGYGLFFLVVTAAQGFYSGLVLFWPRRSVLVAGIAGNAAILVLYALTRTLGVPLVGPHAGRVEAVAMPDLAAAIAEVALVIALVQLLRGLTAPPLAHEETEE